MVVEEPQKGIIGLINGIIGLKQNAILWLDDGIANLEAQVTLRDCVSYSSWCSTTIDTVKNRMSALRNTRLQSPKELVQVFLRVNIADVFEDAQFIVRYCARTLKLYIALMHAGVIATSQ